MRTRSGFTLGKRRRGQETADMADDSQSTDVQWGTPAHTASFSTIDSHPRSPPALSSITENQQPRSNRLASRHVDDGSAGQDTSSYSQAAQPPARTNSVIGDSLRRPRDNRQQLRSNQPHQYNLEVDEDDDVGEAPQSSSSHEVMRRYSESELPWNHIAGEKRSYSAVGREQHPIDRNYPDKMEKELDDLVKGGDDKDIDGNPRKQKKVRRRGGRHYGKSVTGGSNRRNEREDGADDAKGGVRA